jgi:cytidine deaminase
MAYPSGLCAERIAFFAAGAQFPGERIEAAAVVTDREMPAVDFLALWRLPAGHVRV